MNAEECSQYMRGLFRPSTIYKMAPAGQIPSRRIRGKRVFIRPEIDQWLREFNSQKETSSVSRFRSVQQRVRSLKTEGTANLSGSQKGTG